MNGFLPFAHYFVRLLIVTSTLYQNLNALGVQFSKKKTEFIVLHQLFCLSDVEPNNNRRNVAHYTPPNITKRATATKTFFFCLGVDHRHRISHRLNLKFPENDFQQMPSHFLTELNRQKIDFHQ